MAKEERPRTDGASPGAAGSAHVDGTSCRPDDAERERFGERAVRMGFVTEASVRAALDRQRELAKDRRPHVLIGLVLLEMGALTNEQLIVILKSYEDESGGAAL